jgi:zinc/manganese transport system permease protein
MWVGLSLSYVFPHLPPSFCIMAVAAALYLIVLAAQRVRRRLRVGA